MPLTTRITFGTLKGGVGKTTSAVHIALGLARSGRVLLVDADPQAASAYDWAQAYTVSTGEAFPVDVIPWTSPNLAQQIPRIASTYDSLIIDTGGENEEVLASALTITDLLIAPIAPSLIELRRLPATVDLAAKVDGMKQPLGASVEFLVLMVKTRPNTISRKDAIALLAQFDLPVLNAQVSLRERYAQAFGTVPPDLGDYEEVLAEILETDPIPAAPDSVGPVSP